MTNLFNSNNQITQKNSALSSQNKEFLQQFSNNVRDICKELNYITLIDLLANMQVINIPKDHLTDSTLKDINSKIQVLINRGGISIEKNRDINNKLLSNCRDLSMILCEILKLKGFSARVRSGFGTFFHPTKKFDHWICEYWCAEQKQWIKVDAWMAQVQSLESILPSYMKQGLLGIKYNAFNVSDSHFITGAKAWLNCHDNNENFDSYGTYEEELKGVWFVRDNLLRDLLCLNNNVPLPWDCFGLMGRNISCSDEQKQHLNKLAHKIVDNTLTITESKTFLEAFKIQ